MSSAVTKIAVATPTACAMTPPVNAPTTCASPTTTRPYAAMIRPRKASGTIPWSRPFEMAPLRIITQPTTYSTAYPIHGIRVMEKIMSMAGHAIDAMVRSRMREIRSPTAASPSAPVSPPTPRNDSKSP